MQRLVPCLKKCPDSEARDLLELAGKAALSAGAVLKKHYGRPHTITMKGSIDLVTEADVASEQAAKMVITASTGSYPILAEESAIDLSGVGPAWIIDPLDGTTNFAHDIPWFTVSIGFAVDGDCRAGVVYAPMMEEFFCGVREGGAWLNGAPIRVSSVATLATAVLATGFPYYIHERPDDVLAAIREMVTRTQGVRRAGAASLDLAYVACGRFDGFWELNLKPWDTAAGICLVQEAEGSVSDYSGKQTSPFVPETLASNKLLHQEMVACLHPFTTRN